MKINENVVVLNDSIEQAKIDVLTSFYLSEIYITNLVYSLSLVNTFIPINWIVVINSSTEAILTSLENAISKTKIKATLVLLDGVESIYASYNRAIGYASSDFIAFNDMDDIRYPDSLLRQYNSLIESNADASYGDIDIVHEYKGSIVERYNRTPYATNVFLEKSIWSPTQVYRSSVFKKIGLFDEQYLTAGDYEHQCRFAKAGLTAIKTEGVILQYLISYTPAKTHRSSQKIECIAIWDRYNLSHKFGKKQFYPFYYKSLKYDRLSVLNKNVKLPLNNFCAISKRPILTLLTDFSRSFALHTINSSVALMRSFKRYIKKIMLSLNNPE